MPIVEFLGQFAAKKGATPTQIALAWLLAQKPFIVPIPGTGEVDHVNENLGALRVELSAADLQEIETALSKITIGGREDDDRLQDVLDQDVEGDLAIDLQRNSGPR